MRTLADGLGSTQRSGGLATKGDIEAPLTIHSVQPIERGAVEVQEPYRTPVFIDRILASETVECFLG